MRIYIEHDGEELGPYGRERVLHGIRTGKWTAAHRARDEESQEWKTLGALLADELARTPAPEKPKPEEVKDAPPDPRPKVIFLLLLLGVIVYLYTMNSGPPKEAAPIRSFETDPPEWMASPQLPLPRLSPSSTPSPSPKITPETERESTDREPSLMEPDED